MSKRSKIDRQDALSLILNETPLLTDVELAEHFQVSVQTIRLDRLECSIPEVRKRMKTAAQQNLDQIKALSEDEVIGEVIDLNLDKNAISLLDITQDHVFTRNQIARGHYLFAQANSLAIAVMNEEVALTSSANIRFLRPVKLHERVIAKAEVIDSTQEKTRIKVKSYILEELVFMGTFLVHRIDTHENQDR